ncbi:hypothetical protein HAZT_HAZT005693 [Hyalella azteca]|uniref:ATPase AAA-type core domain-containing protein n=1 Tax=Hyalella azteca TaxID=294128 RepID=A0A6A0GNH4_HYAAZ|nr:hypothetical protein HAZT_HAZT005693 [Hyalella azteca]
MLELLNQLDGFYCRGTLRGDPAHHAGAAQLARRLWVIMATNRIETLETALIRSARIDRSIPLPDEKTKRRIFNIHTNKMTLCGGVNFDELNLAKDDLSGANIKMITSRPRSGADIKVICTEAGLMALRERRMKRALPRGCIFKSKEKGTTPIDSKLCNMKIIQ